MRFKSVNHCSLVFKYGYTHCDKVHLEYIYIYINYSALLAPFLFLDHLVCGLHTTVLVRVSSCSLSYLKGWTSDSLDFHLKNDMKGNFLEDN